MLIQINIPGCFFPIDNKILLTFYLFQRLKYISDSPLILNITGFYDTFFIPIDNENNAVIQNNTSKVSLKLKSSGDRYSMFFSAFNVEVKDPVKEVESNLLASKEIKEVCINKEKQLPENALLRFMENYISFRKDIICHST